MIPPLTLARWVFLIPSSGCTRQSKCIIYEAGILETENLVGILDVLSFLLVTQISYAVLRLILVVKFSPTQPTRYLPPCAFNCGLWMTRRKSQYLCQSCWRHRENIEGCTEMAFITFTNGDGCRRYKSRHSKVTCYEELNLMCSDFCLQLKWILQRQSIKKEDMWTTVMWKDNYSISEFFWGISLTP